MKTRKALDEMARTAAWHSHPPPSSNLGDNRSEQRATAQVPPSTQPSPISTLGILSTHCCSYALSVTHNWVFPLIPAGQMTFVGLCHQLHLVRPA
ncbi:E3 Ubiquitin-Protein Ligase Hectd1 [Manis pentadactyla]|nr:E3 Ubiquitin-Protein Ligase Hectd1 [Manis pentadactyla]